MITIISAMMSILRNAIFRLRLPVLFVIVVAIGNCFRKGRTKMNSESVLMFVYIAVSSAYTIIIIEVQNNEVTDGSASNNYIVKR